MHFNIPFQEPIAHNRRFRIYARTYFAKKKKTKNEEETAELMVPCGILA